MDIVRISRRVFAELGREKQLVEYHDILHKLLGVVADFINAEGESLKLSKMRHFNPYCAMIRSSKSGFAACQSCDRANARSASMRRGRLVYKCHAWLTEIILPLYDSQNHYIGGMTSGQFLVEPETPPSRRLLDETARLHGLNPALLRKAFAATKTLTKLQLEGVFDYLGAVGRIIVEAHNKIIFMESVDAPDKIALIKKFVEDNYMRRLAIPAVAKKFCLSPGHFCRLFKKEVGVGFMCFVNMYRVAKAEEMLLSTRKGVAETALLTGFGSVSQFNRTFKSIKGMSPMAYQSGRKSDGR